MPWIGINGNNPAAWALDVEPGDTTPSTAASWALHKLSGGPHLHDGFGVAERAGRRGRLPTPMRSHVRRWIADPRWRSAYRARLQRHPVVLGVEVRRQHRALGLLAVSQDDRPGRLQMYAPRRQEYGKLSYAGAGSCSLMDAAPAPRTTRGTGGKP